MATYTTSIPPRIRVARDASFTTYDRSVSQIATATDVGPSQFPELSQLVDMDLDGISVSDISDRPSPSTSRAPNPSVSAAETLRFLMTRLDAKSLSPHPQDSYGHTPERESDYDMDLTEPAHAARSVVQDSLRDIFTKARRDSGSTPQQAQPRSNNSSMDISNVVSSLKTFSKEGRDNLSDDDLEDAHTSSHRPKTRLKYSPQPVTAEFLRERFSGSRILAESGGEDGQSYHYSAKDASGLSGDMSSFQTNLPVATSTPQQSLRMSFNSQFQSNLLDQDSEMQNAIRDLVSDDNSTHRSASPPSTVRKRAPLRSEFQTPVHGFDDVEDTSKTPMPIRHPHRPVSPISRPWAVQQAQSADMSDNAEFANGTSLMSETKQPTPSAPQSHSNQISGSSDSVKSSRRHSPPGSSGHKHHRSRSKSPHTASFQRDNVYNSRSTQGVSNSQETHLRGDYSREQEIEVSRRSSRPGLSNQYETHESNEDDEEQSAHSYSGGVTFSKVERNSFEVDANPSRSISWRNGISPRSSRTPSPRPSADQIAKPSYHSSPMADKNSPTRAHPTVTRSLDNFSGFKSPRTTSAVRGNGKRTTVHSDEDDKNDDFHFPSATGSPQFTGTPRSNGKGRSASQDMQESDWSPSTTPPRQTPKFHTQYLPLSPTNDPPDLPTPPSDSELENKTWNFDATPRGNTSNRQEPSSLPTPKPPGGWLQTPAPLRQLSKPPTTPSNPSEVVKEEISDVDANTEPETPMKNPYEERYPFKTPKPPGGWQTPATVTQKRPEPRSLEVETGKSDQQLLTPVPSLSKGSAYNLRTPYVPGGWAATPRTRKSVLKVRFNHELDSSYAQDSDDAHKQRVLDATPTARKPATPHIRIVDSFGREHDEDDSSRLSESMPPEGPVDHSVQHVSRSDLLSRIRRGFDDLVEDIESTEDPDTNETREALSIEQAKIKELQAQSMQARRNREYLLEQASKIRTNPALPIKTLPSTPLPAPSSHRRLYAILFLMQVFFILLMYRLSVVRAKSLFLSSYYDPFNPELYLYIFKHDTSFSLANADFSRTSQQSMGSNFLEEGARMWSCCRHLVNDAFSYFWTLWTGDAASRTTRLSLT